MELFPSTWSRVDVRQRGLGYDLPCDTTLVAPIAALAATAGGGSTSRAVGASPSAYRLAASGKVATQHSIGRFFYSCTDVGMGRGNFDPVEALSSIRTTPRTDPWQSPHRAPSRQARAGPRLKAQAYKYRGRTRRGGSKAVLGAS